MQGISLAEDLFAYKDGLCSMWLVSQIPQTSYKDKDQFLKDVHLTYLTVSADPLSPPTVENLTAIGVFLPMFEKTLALQYFVMSCVTSK